MRFARATVIDVGLHSRRNDRKNLTQLECMLRYRLMNSRGFNRYERCLRSESKAIGGTESVYCFRLFKPATDCMLSS